MPNIQDTIEKVSSLDVGLISRPLVTITFKRNYFPNLLSLLQICHGIQKHGLIFKAPHVVMDCSDNFFALALVLNVTRTCLPHRVLVDTSEPDHTPLEELWQDIYQLLQRQGYAFWENTIAEHTNNLARELIYRLARYKVLLLLGSKPNKVAGPSVAASTIARIEALVDNRELADPTVWDKAWDMHWREVWRRSGPVAQLRHSGGIQSIASIAGAPTTISPTVDGCAPGRIAGRTPVKLILTESSSILLNSIWSGPNSRLPEMPLHGPNETNILGGKGQSVEPKANKSRPLAEIAASNIYSIPVAERYNCTVWATPRESAIESAWAAAWSEAESYGETAARSVLEANKPEAGPPNQATQAGARSRAGTTTHPSVLGAISATKAAARFAARASHRFSVSFNKGRSDQEPPTNAVVNPISPTGETGLVTAPSQTLPETAPSPSTACSPTIGDIRGSIPRKIVPTIETSSLAFAAQPQIGNNSLSPITPRSRKTSGTSSKLRSPSVPGVGLHSISEASSHVDLSIQAQADPNPPIRVSRTASEPFPVDAPVQTPVRRNSESSDPPSTITFTRRRSESATQRLRKHVITRWSDPQRYSEFEDAFVDKTQERHYREKKESARIEAAKTSDKPDFLAAELRKAGPRQRAEVAWEQMVAHLGKNNFEKKLQILAQQEWEKLVERQKKTHFSGPLGDQPGSWETDFALTWQRAWKESWETAWTAVWKLSYKEATSRGIEFGTEEILDLDPKLKRRTLKQLEASDSYVQLRESLLENKSPLGSLEQVHQWMKELSYLSESLQYS
ncbi:hypothetical protein FRC11_014285, partial [Ceratobasidium sp. 423]